MAALAGWVLAQAAGIWAADRAWVSAADGLWRAAVLCAALGVAWRGAGARGVRVLAAVVLGGLAGAGAMAARLEASRAWRAEAPREARVQGEVARIARHPGGAVLDLRHAAAVDGSGGRGGLRVFVDAAPPRSPWATLQRALPGDRLRADLRLSPAWRSSNPGGPHLPERALWRRGIGATGRAVHPARVVRLLPSGGCGRWRRRLAQTRRAAALALEASGPGGPVLAALALGERGGLARESREAFRRLGISHLLAVSGLHLGLVAALSFALGRGLLGRLPGDRAPADPRRAALVGAAAAAVAYALLSGWGVPVRRGLVLLLALGSAVLLRRPHAGLAPLWLAAAVILALEPEALFAPGAWLSFAATTALVVGLRRGGTGARPGSAPGALHTSVSASALALAATAPIAASALGTVSPAALPVNLVAVPWTALLLLPAALMAAAAALVAAATGATVPGHGLLVGAAERIGAVTVAAAHDLAPLAPVAERAAPAPWALVASGVIAAVAVGQRGLPGRVAGATAVVALLTLAPPPGLDPPPPRAVFLDVGHGDATLVQTRGAAVLVDAAAARPGGADRGRTTVAPALAALGVSHLDLLVVTHGDVDHRGGVPAVLARLPVTRVWLPAAPASGERGEALEHVARLARHRGARVRRVHGPAPPLRLPGMRVVPLWPRGPKPSGAPGAPLRSENDGSLVVRIDLPTARVLLPGDLERPGETALLAAAPPGSLRATLLKLGHHGSRTSSSEAWLDAVAPRLAVASAPRFGHRRLPHPEVVRRVARHGAWVGWTGRDGALVVGLGADRRVRTWRRGWIPRAETGWGRAGAN